MNLLTPSQDQWNAFVTANAADGGLLQSWEWGVLEKAEGNEIHRLAWGEGDKIEACALLVERKLPFGWKYLYCPRGPIVAQKHLNTEALKHTTNELAAFAKQHHAVFLRLEPVSNFDIRISNLKRTQTIQPNKTIRINLQQTEGELLTKMHQKTRYNIRLAQQRGVTVESYKVPSNPYAFQHFAKLLKETTARDQFHGHTAKHYQLLLQHLNASLYLAEHDGDIIAGAIIAYFGTTAYYLHGASANEKRNVMAPYLLHWRVIQDTKQRGCTIYDLWGVDADRWPGVTRFKVGFAPNEPITEYPGTFDLSISTLKYALYSLKRRIR